MAGVAVVFVVAIVAVVVVVMVDVAVVSATAFGDGLVIAAAVVVGVVWV